jgi:hypothetical protein
VSGFCNPTNTNRGHHGGVSENLEKPSLKKSPGNGRPSMLLVSRFTGSNHHTVAFTMRFAGGIF